MKPHSTESPVQTATNSQQWNTAAYAENGRFVANLAGDVTDLLAPQPGERILDLGCGDGALTERLMATGAVVTGVDNSANMIDAARERGIDARLLPAEQLTFVQEFDAAFSNAALHWIRNQDAVLRGVHRALKPGGRFVAEMGGIGNIASIRVALQAVLREYGIDAEAEAASFFPSPAEYTRLLEAAGFHVETIALIPRPTPLPSGVEAWLNTFRNGVLNQLSAGDRLAALEKTLILLRPVLCDHAGNWTADYVRLRFKAFAR